MESKSNKKKLVELFITDIKIKNEKLTQDLKNHIEYCDDVILTNKKIQKIMKKITQNEAILTKFCDLILIENNHEQ
jgi:hypothetical protein